MRLLDLFSGAGGAGMGYHRAGFEVTGVDIAPQPRYPFTFVQADALEYLAAHGHEYDAIHASPPCQAYTRTNAKYRNQHPDMIADVRSALKRTSKPYIIENVEDARSKLIAPILFCGSMFGLRIFRHRLFELGGFYIKPVFGGREVCRHDFEPVLITGVTRRKGLKRRENVKGEKVAAIGIDWMTVKELDQAIPPAYTEYIGGFLKRHLMQSVYCLAR